MLLASLWSAVRLASLALTDRHPIPGMNIDGTHLPIVVTVASAMLVGWGGARRVHALARLAHGA
ncbi:MAG: hypothetical protein R3F35_20260 [Myxococcota bacterium]